jgi:CRP-like cAMP-binding protein
MGTTFKCRTAYRLDAGGLKTAMRAKQNAICSSPVCAARRVIICFNSAEKRLARTLLLLARFGKEGRSENLVPHISQETLAEMVGTTRARVNFFMNRFARLHRSF